MDFKLLKSFGKRKISRLKIFSALLQKRTAPHKLDRGLGDLMLIPVQRKVRSRPNAGLNV